jgi:hypothetical protein
MSDASKYGGRTIPLSYSHVYKDMGLAAVWRELDIVSKNVKAYLAREDPGIDYSTVIGEMFLSEDRRNYTYTFSKETRRIVQITYPQDKISVTKWACTCLSLSHRSIGLGQG